DFRRQGFTLYRIRYNEGVVMKGILITAVVAAGLTVAGGESVRADVLLSGPDANAGSYSTSALAGIANASDTVTYNGLVGISWWGFLGGGNAATPTSPNYGAITTSTPAGDNAKNSILRYYLLAGSGSGSYSAVSLGKINPSFGGTAAAPAF